VLSQIEVSVDDDGRAQVSGGREQFIQPWWPDEADLAPTVYRYEVPARESAASPEG
jgi:hypothetical protein